MKSKYTAENIFTDVKIEKFPRHKFNKSYFNKLTLNHGYAVPFFVDDVLPGDRFDLKTFGRIQLQPLATSSMQNMRCYFRYFYVPYRLVWENWDKFISQDPNDETAILAPYTHLNNIGLTSLSRSVGHLADYLGVGVTPNKVYSDTTKLQFNLFRFAAYYLIWNEYFRDENLQTPTGLVNGQYLSDGYQDYTRYLVNLLPVAYQKDYFTTALPFQQAGRPVNLSAFVSSDTFTTDIVTQTASPNSFFPLNHRLQTDSSGVVNLINNGTGTPSPGLVISPRSIEDAELTIPSETLVTSININDLRYSNALQRFLERKALGGSRPAEFYLSMYGVRVDDLRIGRPFYLGGGYTNVTITDVASSVQTTQTVDGVSYEIPQGTLAGNGKSFPAISINKPYYCQEPGVVMGIMYIRPEINYLQGLPRQMQVFRTLDYYNPIFAHLGEEAVLKSELVIYNGLDNTTSESNNDETFGYQSRYAYLKHRRNEVHGDFKTTLSNWVLAPILPDNVTLDDTFITVQQDYSIFAATDKSEHHYLCELFNQYEVESSMPDFAIPSL